jgi:hypothetical protein
MSNAKKILANAFGRAVAKVRQKGKPQAASTVAVVPVVSGETKLARNAVCPCGSGRKLKKCCGSTAALRAVATQAEVFVAATKGIPQTAAAMLRAGIEPQSVYAYYHTADYICDENRQSKSEEALAIWDAHSYEFLSVPAEMQQQLLDDITTVKVSK